MVLEEPAFCRGDHQCMGQCNPRQGALVLPHGYVFIESICGLGIGAIFLKQFSYMAMSYRQHFTFPEGVHVSQCKWS